MTVLIPTLVPAIQAVSNYIEKQRANLSDKQLKIMLEICRRLERLELQAADLIVINKLLCEKQGSNIDFDSSTDTITFSVGGESLSLKLKRANPDVPITMLGEQSSISAYNAGTSQTADEEEQNLRIELEEKLESYYQSAHRILKLFGRMSCLPKIKCDAISRVRNELIEHPEDGSLYSFGVGSKGPCVKPMHRGEPKFIDEGLVPNTQGFIDAIVAGCEVNLS